MPFAIDTEAARQQMFLNISRPQEVVQREPDGSLRDGFLGTNSGGLPVKQIPVYDFPRAVYMHPNQPTQTIVHRNTEREIVEEEEVALEALTKLVGCTSHMKAGGPKDCPECFRLLKAALADGWRIEPYLPVAPEKPDAHLYGPRKK